VVTEATGGRGADVALNGVGASIFSDLLASLAEGGAWSCTAPLVAGRSKIGAGDRPHLAGVESGLLAPILDQRHHLRVAGAGQLGGGAPDGTGRARQQDRLSSQPADSIADQAAR
jgi:hypothetical protein